jgi:hypothetical protein
MVDEEQLRILMKAGGRGLEYLATPGWVEGPVALDSWDRSYYVRGTLMKHNTSGSEAPMIHSAVCSAVKGRTIGQVLQGSAATTEAVVLGDIQNGHGGTTKT